MLIQDLESFKKWQKIIPRTDRKLTHQDKVCELHFSEEEVEKFYVTKLSEGTINKIEKGRYTLKPGAIPTIFPTVTMPLLKTVEQNMPSHPSIYRIKQEDISPNVSETEEEMSLASVDTGLIKVPNEWWSVARTPQYIICTKWNESYDPEFRVVIQSDSSVKIFIRDREFTEENRKTSVEEVSSLLMKVDSYEVCAGVSDRSIKTCLGHLGQSKSLGRFSTWCNECCINRKKDYGCLHLKQFKNTVPTSKKMKHHLNCDQRKSDLEKKVIKIEKDLVS